MAGLAVLQMDQAKSQNQNLLRYIRKRGQNASLDRDLGVRAGCQHEKTIPLAGESLHNFTDPVCHLF